MSNIKDRQTFFKYAPTANPAEGYASVFIDPADDLIKARDHQGNVREFVPKDLVVDNLESTDSDRPLSANQGKNLQDNKEDADSTILKEGDVEDSLNSTSTTKPLSANQGKQLNDDKASLSALGSMSEQDSDDVDITGGTAVLSELTSPVYYFGSRNALFSINANNLDANPTLIIEFNLTNDVVAQKICLEFNAVFGSSSPSSNANGASVCVVFEAQRSDGITTIVAVEAIRLDSSSAISSISTTGDSNKLKITFNGLDIVQSARVSASGRLVNTNARSFLGPVNYLWE